MSYERVNGGAVYVDNERFTLADGNQVRAAIDFIANGQFRAGAAIGGTFGGDAIEADTAGDPSLADALKWVTPVRMDNTSSQYSGFSDSNGAVRVARFVYMIKVSNVAFSVTPKVLYGTTIPTITTPATIAGESACSDTDADYSGSADQIQEVDVTTPAGVKWLLPIWTIGGVPTPGYSFNLRIWFDHFIEP
jgi:hypothetical protein